MPTKRIRPPASVQQWLTAHGRTQVWLSHELGISIAETSRIVRGVAMPRALLAMKITALTGVTGDDLLRAKAEHTPDNRAERMRKAKTQLAHVVARIAAISEEVT